ncbi:MAG TPA: hypothetical protein VGC67_00170 [Cellulomonas sp.]
MTENPGTTPPNGEEPSTPAAGQPTPPPQAPPVTPAESAQPGAYPPPGAGYGPPAGGYPPPTADPYGQQPPAAAPYPPQQPYGQAAYQPGNGQVGVGEAFNWGWTKFTQNALTLLIAVLGFVIVIGIVAVVLFAIAGAAATVTTDAYGNTTTAGAAGSLFGTLLITAVIVLLAVFAQASIIRAVVEIANGRTVDFGTFFRFDDFGKVLVAALIVGLGTAIGELLFVLPGLVFAFFAQFTLYFVIDKGLAAVDALKASFSLVNRNLGTVVLLFLGVYVANAIGGALCGIGLLVSVPVGLLATVFLYRRLQNEPIAA